MESLHEALRAIDAAKAAVNEQHREHLWKALYEAEAAIVRAEGDIVRAELERNRRRDELAAAVK
jgi:hypothetical protein